MNKILKISLLTSIMIGSHLQASEVELQKEINALKAEIKEIKQSTNESIDELYERADSNEFEATMNRIKWGGGVEIGVNNFDGTTGSMTTPMGKMPGTKYSNANKWTNKVKLSMEAKINDKARFVGRLSMYKNWADSTANMMHSDPNEGKHSNSGTSAVFLERAYVNYKINDILTTTVGRQPSSDGPGMSLRENTPRQATYPALLFDGNADGIILTANAGDVKNVFKSLKFRAAYGKGFQQDDAMNGFLANDNSVDDLDVAGVFAESALDFPAMGENLIVLSYVKASNFVGSSMNVASPNNVNLGDFDLMGLYFENNKAFGTKLNYFFSYAYSKGASNGKTVNYGPMTGNQNVKLIDDSASAFHVGARYDFDSGFKLGYEFNHGGKNWFSFTQGSEDPLNKLATRGDAHDIYAIYQLDMNQFLR
ncbi:MAG TPA: DUF3373 family protein, partial [Epsilonproteobacteria bacterium]|nr:DUF3373 family protein [Campylobacterota bacterium]